MNEYEISKLKKELLRKNDVIREMKDDLDFVEKQLITAQAERDKYHGELQIARQTIQNVDQIIDQKVRDMKTKLQYENATALNQLQTLRDRLIEEKNLTQKYNQQIRNKDAVISQLSLRLRQMSIKYKDPSLQINVKQVSEQASITYNQFYKLTEKYNRLSEDMENIMAENKILRKLHGVPDNFGFDLQQIKIAEKQELEDYKAQCRKLQTQIQELEAERTQLRYRLRQYNTLYSNKGERYKDLTQRQLELLDAYALNLKDGRNQLPEIDKSQKQMQREIIRLRAQIQVLQTKNPIGIISSGKQQGGQINKQSMKKIELQIKAMLEPFVQDIKKLSETNVISLIQNIQNNQGDTVINHNVPTSGLRPPIPLPISHNDWSTIKQGYSYRYACKIPIDLKDYQGEIGFDIVRAKYEIAALQLQNIESLKMIKEKQDSQNLIRSQLNDLKEKYKKCLLVQDDLFVKYFKMRDEYKENSKINDIDKRKVTDQRDQIRSQLSILKETFNTLSYKSDIENKFRDFGERLAKSQAGVLKAERKYQIIFDQHQHLRDAYTKMQLKAAQNETHLKAKYLNAKKNQKQLTMLMNQVLQQTKDSVSSDTHSLLLSKMETLNDKQAQSAFKQAQLRIKIARLESIERQMNIKDEVIEYLREDKLDILLEAQILKNRLKSIDPVYRKAFALLQRFVNFINENNVSIMECFKKFDRDKSGSLTKQEYKRALDTFGFKLDNNEFQLFYNQFDLDGSGNLSYSEFLRKLKRQGAISRSADQQAVHLFFKAIKHSKISIKQAFRIVDTDNSLYITKRQMQTAFGLIGIDSDSKTIDAIFRMIDGDDDGKITCEELQKLYEDIIKVSQIDEYELKTVLDWKYKFLLQLQIASIKNKLTLEQAFKSLDEDRNSYMTINQLSAFLTKIGVYLEKSRLDELFKFMDVKIDGKIQYSEFMKLLDEAKKQERKVQRMQAVRRRAKQLRDELEKQNQVLQNQAQGKSKIANKQAIQNIKMQALVAKQNSLAKKNEKLCKSLANKEQQIKDLQKNIEENDKQLRNVQDKYTKQRQTNITLQQKMKNYVGEIEAKRLKQQHQKIKIENNELSTQLATFKGLCSSLTDKNKMQLMSVEKLKAQLNKYYDIVKDLQVQNINKAQLGRLALQLQYSKRNEEIVNKKYEDVCQQTKTLATENHSLADDSLEKQKQIVNVYLLMRQKTNLMQKNIDSLTGKILPTVTATKIDQFTNKLRQISSSKSQLQEQNKLLREKNFSLQLKYDHIEIQKQNLLQLQKKLRRNYTDESSIALMDLTKQLSDNKMSELKVKRQYNLLKEKEQYYMRINNANNDNIKQLQGELGKWQIKYNEREEFWRKRMADQMKLAQQIRREVQKNKESEIKSKKYFNEKKIEQDKIQDQYNSLSEERQAKLSKFAKPPSVYREIGTNNQQLQELKNQVNELTKELQQKQRENYQLRTAIQDIVPQQKLKFSTIGSQIGGGNQARSFILQTDLTTSQLKSNARRFLNSQKDQQAFFRQEAQRMAQAAQHSIDTLQRIIDDKNDQLKRKQKMIEDLKRELLKNKQEDCYEIQKLNEQIRQLRSKGEMNNINQLMNKSTYKGFNPGGGIGGNQQRVRSLMEMIDEKDTQIRNWEKKYNQLYINKAKVKPAQNSANNKIIESKLRQLTEERQNEKQRYIEAQNKLKERVKNLQKLIKEKDVKLGQLQKSLTQLKEDVMNEKQQLSNQAVKSNEQFIANLKKGTTANDSKMQVMLQKAMQTIQTMTKKNRQYEAEIKRLRDQSKLNKTMSRR